MFKKTMKKIACCVMAALSLTACVTTMTACETDHPEVKMKLEFNGETYTLEYKLYRKIAPSTVDHFIWLVENDYYDGLCIHDYDADSKMVTGGYTYSAETTDNGGLTYKPYYDTVANFSKFPASVWKDSEKKEATYTVFGEFEDNKFTVEKGDLDETFGSLTMYYYSKSVDTSVYTKYQKADKKGETRIVDYKYNSATSLFYISLSEDATDNTAYCTFATLKSDSVSKLEKLQEAIAKYNSEDFTEKITNVLVEQDDLFLGEKKSSHKQNFDVPTQPIIIKSMKVTKY